MNWSGVIQRAWAITPLLALVASALPARARSRYPDRPIRLIIPFDALFRATEQVTRDKSFQTESRDLGFESVDSSSEKASRFIKEELVRWAPIIRRRARSSNDRPMPAMNSTEISA